MVSCCLLKYIFQTDNSTTSRIPSSMIFFSFLHVAPLDLSQSSTTATTEQTDDDVILVMEDTVTKEQMERARKYQLPDQFYLYETRPQCKGCLGCLDDFDFSTIGGKINLTLPRNSTRRGKSVAGKYLGSDILFFGGAYMAGQCSPSRTPGIWTPPPKSKTAYWRAKSDMLVLFILLN